MFDFAADARDQGGEPGMNHKGLVTFDRKLKKDSFYLYKAWWSDEPFVHICGKRYVDRTEKSTVVKVYSNQHKVSLYADGKLVEEKTGDKVFSFKVTLTMDKVTRLEAKSGNLSDTAQIHKVNSPNPSYRIGKAKQKNNWV
jgi:beta-galactosidase